MITYIPLDKDTLSRDIVCQYSKYEGSSASFETKAFSIVKDKHLIDYLEALEELFKHYKFEENHLSNVLFIIGQHLFIYSTLEEKRTDALEAAELLLFLKNYHLQNEELKRKYPDVEKYAKQELKRKVEFTTAYPTAYPIKLQDIHFIANGIYKLFRNQSYNHLKETLAPYEEIPPLEIVKELNSKNQYIIDYPDRYFLAELTLDLLEYLNSTDISNKYRFIYDLLFLSQLFHLDKEATKDIEFITDGNRFDPSGMLPTNKTTYIKDILKAYKIYIKRNS